MGADPPRRLLFAPPGHGKSYALRGIMRRWGLGRVVAYDPVGDLRGPLAAEGAAVTWTDPDAGGLGVVHAAARARPGTLFVVDEVHRLIPPWASLAEGAGWHPMLSALDVFRNAGLGFVVATKQPTLLPPLVTTLCDGIAWGPLWAPAVRAWCRRAELPDDAPVGAREWAVAHPGVPWRLCATADLPEWAVTPAPAPFAARSG